MQVYIYISIYIFFEWMHCVVFFFVCSIDNFQNDSFYNDLLFFFLLIVFSQGTETQPYENGHMEGAVKSAQRAAKQVLEALKK